jgi:hypothetical protein
MSDGPSIRNHRITKTYFRTCSTIGLAVKLPSTFTLYARLPTVLRVPLHSSVTLWEETAPVKLPNYTVPPGFTGSG